MSCDIENTVVRGKTVFHRNKLRVMQTRWIMFFITFSARRKRNFFRKYEKLARSHEKSSKHKLKASTNKLVDFWENVKRIDKETYFIRDHVEFRLCLVSWNPQFTLPTCCQPVSQPTTVSPGLVFVLCLFSFFPFWFISACWLMWCATCAMKCWLRWNVHWQRFKNGRRNFGGSAIRWSSLVCPLCVHERSRESFTEK